MENIEEMKKRSEAIDYFLDMISDFKDAPLDFKILSISRKADVAYREIQMDKAFMNLKDNSEEKQALYSFEKQRMQFYTDLKEKLKD